MVTRQHLLAASLVLALVAGGCGHTTPATAPATTSTTLAAATSTPTSAPATTAAGRDPAESAHPTAGACGLAEGAVGEVAIDDSFVPSPRCLVIRHDQRLAVVNRASHSVTAVLGTHLRADIAPGRRVTFEPTVGEVLEPGVHALRFSPASAADIWVDAVCRGPGAADCANP